MSKEIEPNEAPENEVIHVCCGTVGDLAVDDLAERKPCEQKWCQNCPTLVWVTVEGLKKLAGKKLAFLCRDCFLKKTEREQAAGEEIIVIKNERRN